MINDTLEQGYYLYGVIVYEVGISQILLVQLYDSGIHKCILLQYQALRSYNYTVLIVFATLLA